MSETPVQVIIAAFSTPDGAGNVMDELKQGKKAGLIGIVDAAVVVKDADGKLNITDARRRSRHTKGFVTGGVVGGLIGLLAGPVGWAALGGGAIGALSGRIASLPIKTTMESIGESLTPNSSAIVAIVEHTWVPQIEAALAIAGAQVAHEVLMTDIAAQLQAGGNVLYTAAAGNLGAGAARMADGPNGRELAASLAAKNMCISAMQSLPTSKAMKKAPPLTRAPRRSGLGVLHLGLGRRADRRPCAADAGGLRSPLARG